MYTYKHFRSTTTDRLRNGNLSETHTIRQTEIPALLDTWVTNMPSVKMFSPQEKTACLFIFLQKKQAGVLVH
jgi:hypothetical protein